MWLSSAVWGKAGDHCRALRLSVYWVVLDVLYLHLKYAMEFTLFALDGN